ncbi:MAG: ornithine carbamoyltransferase [Synechococcales cyanobacterium CRU_2_2]|nr:ornithine carbamoyltransferase [Synechococcales cyanobacterium CRU_2_2]
MGALQGKDLLTLTDLTAEQLRDLLDLAADLKTGKLKPQTNKTLGLIFSKASTRTRVSFSAAMYQLGGNVLDLNPNVTQVGRGEPIADTARVLSRYLDVLAIRTFKQADLAEYAQYADIPVINALTDSYHPCQILADLQTIQAEFGSLAGLTLAYCGDGNNMAHSLMLGCALSGMHVRIAAPEGYQPLPEIVTQAQKIAQVAASPGASEVLVTSDVQAAVQGAHVVYTDVWASMGQESEADSRLPVFQPYQVNEALMDLADPEAIALHCLPAHRGEEISEAVMEGSQSRIWDQAENRLHAQKALLVSLLGLV